MGANLTDQQKTRLEAVANVTLPETGWDDMPDIAKRKIIDDVISGWRDIARAEMLNRHPELIHPE